MGLSLARATGGGGGGEAEGGDPLRGELAEGHHQGTLPGGMPAVTQSEEIQEEFFSLL